jgi:hypothetical protein
MTSMWPLPRRIKSKTDNFSLRLRRRLRTNQVLKLDLAVQRAERNGDIFDGLDKLQLTKSSLPK